MCEGKEHAIAIGTMVMEPQEIKDVNKGIGIEVAHYLNDGLWHLKHVKWMFCTLLHCYLVKLPPTTNSLFFTLKLKNH